LRPPGTGSDDDCCRERPAAFAATGTSERIVWRSVVLNAVDAP
jgi:hypothetical protein